MQGDNKFSWRKRGLSFRYAWQGIRALFRDEHNARIHLCVCILVVAAGFVFSISAVEWCIVLLCCGAVFAAEAFNSAIEALADHVAPEYAPLIKKAKDVGAAAVLLLVIFVVMVGIIIFLPKLINLCTSSCVA